MKKGLLILLCLPMTFSCLEKDIKKDVNRQAAIKYYRKGTASTERGNYNDAIADFTNAIRIYPDAAKVYNNRGIAYKHLENYEKAITDYTTAIRIDSNFAAAYANRGIAKEKIGLSYCSDYKRACDLGYDNSCKWYYEQCR